MVLLDLLMPVLGGNEVYQAMQQEPRLINVPVIVMTSDPSRAPSGLLIMKKPMNLARLLSTSSSTARPPGPYRRGAVAASPDSFHEPLGRGAGSGRYLVGRAAASGRPAASRASTSWAEPRAERPPGQRLGLVEAGSCGWRS